MPFTAQNLTFSYGESPVIRDLSLSLSPGRFYGILGPNGCGKSTLLDLLCGHLKSESGEIRYGGKPIGKWTRPEIAREMALVPQNYHINFPFTSKEVVLMGRYPHIPRFSRPSAQDMEIVESVMEMTETAGFSDRYISELSGGERQRVVFARALAQDTPVLILDEATANLDINHVLSLLEIAAQGVGKQGKTVISVMQEINFAALFCEEMIFMKEGTVAAAGPTPAVLTPENLQRIYGVKAKVADDDFSGAKQVTFRRGQGC